MRKYILLTMLILVLALLAPSTQAAPQALDIPWWTVDGGGGSSEGGDYILSGSIGQPEAGYQMTGGTYRLEGGFWGGGALVTGTLLYLPMVTR